MLRFFIFLIVGTIGAGQVSAVGEELAVPGIGAAQMSLQQALSFAMERYRPARVAKEQVMLAQMRLIDAQRNFFPKVSLSWTESHGEISAAEFLGREYKAEFDQPIFHSGELLQAYRQARANFQVSRHRYAKVKLDLVLDVGRAYYQLARELRANEEYQQLARALEADRNLAQAAYHRDVIPAVEWLHADSIYQQAKLQEASSDQEIALARLELQRALGWEGREELTVEPTVKLTLRYIPITLDQAIQLAFEHRPELLMHQAAKEAAQAGERSARAKGGPKLDLRASVGKGSEVARPRDLDFTRQWFVGLQGSVPLGPHTFEYAHNSRKDFPRVSATQSTELDQDQFKLNIWDNKWQIEHQEAQVALEQASHELTESTAQLRREVKEAYYLYRKALIDVEATLARIDFQEREVAILKLRANHQEVPLSEVMEAKMRLAQERIGHIKAITDYYIALVALNKAIGMDNYYKVLE